MAWPDISDPTTIAALTLEEQIKKLPPHELVSLKWYLQRRPSQTPPDPLPLIWALIAGRGSGKTLTGANHVFETAKSLPNTPNNRIVRVGLVSDTFTDVRITMIEGETGVRSIIPQDLEIAWNRSLGEYKFIIPGPNYREVHCFAYSSERPDLLRGPQHHIVWLDEPAKMKDADADPTKEGTTWSNLIGGLRLGPSPHCIVTGTPTPCRLIRYLLAHPNCIIHKMSTFENEENLPQEIIEEYRRIPRTSRTARQEYFAEVLLDNPDSIFNAELIEEHRADPSDSSDINYVLGYDPSMTANVDSDEAGIIVAGWIPAVKEKDENGHLVETQPIQAYILGDYSGHLMPNEQTQTVLNLIIEKNIPEIIMEQNQGAEFVLTSLETAMQNHPDIGEFYKRMLKKKPSKAGTIKRWKYTLIFKDKRAPHTFILHAIHAKVNKIVRADSVSIRYETGQVHHPTQGLPICTVSTCGANLEDQMVTWDETKKNSPDRMDACFIAGTLIETEYGLVPIEKIDIGTKVWTRAGLKSVNISGQTGVEKVYSVLLSNGSCLTGTGGHPIWTEESGWVQLQDLMPGAILYSWTRLKKLYGLMESNIYDNQTRNLSTKEIISGAKKSRGSPYTEQFGLNQMVQFLQAITSTIKTKIPSIIKLKILFVFLLKSMLNFILKKINLGNLKNGFNTSKILDHSHYNGINQMKEKPGTDNMLKKLLNKEKRGSSVLNVTKKLKKWIVENFAVENVLIEKQLEIEESAGSTILNENVLSVEQSLLSISMQDISPVHVVAVVDGLSEKLPVYNLEVDDCHEYFANGVLVHNCVYTLLHIFGEHSLSTRRPATLHTATGPGIPQLPQYDPRKDLSRSPEKLSKSSRAYNIDIFGGNSGFDPSADPYRFGSRQL